MKTRVYDEPIYADIDIECCDHCHGDPEDCPDQATKKPDVKTALADFFEVMEAHFLGSPCPDLRESYDRLLANLRKHAGFNGLDRFGVVR